jgi:hypothetical protein
MILCALIRDSATLSGNFDKCKPHSTTNTTYSPSIAFLEMFRMAVISLQSEIRGESPPKSKATIVHYVRVL